MSTDAPRSQNGCERRIASPDDHLPRALQSERERFWRNASKARRQLVPDGGEA